MPSFNFSGLGGGSAAAKDYSYLSTQLDIKQNQLESDGKLSPGDYDLLTKMARDAYTHPGLTPQQRNDIAVKISSYQKGKSTSSLSDANNIGRLNNEVSDDYSKNSMIFGNNPSALLSANAHALQLKASQLSTSIDDLENSGGDSSSHTNEYIKTVQEYNDTLAALNDVKTYKGGKPTTDYAAFVTTNSKGEVSDVKVGRIGSNSGYVETNGVYGGLPLYGKINSKENGKNIFKLGPNTFSASDYMIPDPANPGAVKGNPLISDDQKTGLGFQGAHAGQFKDIDLSQVKNQTALSAGEWAKGPSGAYYKRGDDGSYTKYVNQDPSKLGIDPTQVLSVPKSFENNILVPSSKNTVDGAAPPAAPLSPGFAPNAGNQTTTTPVSAPASSSGPSIAPPASNSRTQAPVSRAPSSAEGVASDTQQKAGGFLSRLFGGVFGGGK